MHCPPQGAVPTPLPAVDSPTNWALPERQTTFERAWHTYRLHMGSREYLRSVR